ncbi:MAG: DNA polymerase III subunit gamma/tau [Ruminococcaceae bacterium]|nr:DNA polymerase III subunit gamma/tau [Oscillospiraceae bacterium]
MYQALYRKYRPQTFDDVVGQGAVTQTLKTQLLSGHMSHAYLFTGSRGTGKTSCAKILSKAVNCLDPHNGNPCNVCEACKAIDAGTCMDVLEIDAASNNGVDNVRDLRDDAIYAPSQVRKRVYIIDEVHMLSISAFNALLKIIEEPPEHLLFILATTELHKVPATILSRCQRFSFRRITPEDIAARLQYVSYQEGIELDDGAARVLARLADGGMRDGLSLLDQCASATVGELNAQRVYECLGIAGEQTCGQMLSFAADRNTRGALELFNRLYADGKDVAALIDELASLCRDLMILKTAPEAGISMLSGVASDADAKSLVKRFSTGALVRMIGLLQSTAAGFTRSSSRRLDAELCIMNLCDPALQMDAEALNARISKLEEQLRTGNFVSPAAAPQQPKPEDADDGDAPPPPGDDDAPVDPDAPAQQAPKPQSGRDDTPMGFWVDLAAAMRPELPPALRAFLDPTGKIMNAVVRGDRVGLICADDFVMNMVDKPEVRDLAVRKASAMLGRPVTVKVVNRQAERSKSKQMEQLMAFGREHSDIIKIKNN